MKLKVRHMYDFGDARGRVGDRLLEPAAWDKARLMSGSFALPATRAEWLRLADQDDLQRRAKDVIRIATHLDASSLCSHGVGTGMLEVNLQHAAPWLRIVCTDFAPLTVERLKHLFVGAEVVLRNLTDPVPPVADLHLMHRLDAELDDIAWRRVFEQIDQTILFVPNVLLNFQIASREIGRRLLRPGRLTDAGWFRNEEALQALWCDTHTAETVDVGGTLSFVLMPRSGEHLDDRISHP